jgi:hypothetical protein
MLSNFSMPLQPSVAARAFALTLIVFAARRAHAQAVDTVRFNCDGRVITSIEIEPHPPALIGRDPSGIRRAVQHFVFQSATTRERAIRPFVLARPRQRCSDESLAELARVVRAQPYIATAAVRAEPDSGGGVRLVDETTDDVPLVIGGGYTRDGLTNLKYGNANVGGTGLLAVGQWRQGDPYRDGLAVTVRQFGFAGQPVVATLDAQRDLLGGHFTLGVTRPFLSDLEHIAWYAGGTHENAFRSFVRSDGPALRLSVDRDIWSAGTVARFSWRGAGVMLGPVATFERARPAAHGDIASDSGLVPADTTALENRYTPYRTFRAGLAGGMRWLSYIHVQGFDALAGEQDIARGFQVAATAERGLGLAGATDRSSLVSLDLYGGAGSPHSFVGLALRGEELPSGADSTWSNAVVSGRSAWYVRTSQRSTFEASAEFSGGWRERLPLQLSLGNSISGLRGYNGAAIAGGRRLVIRLEQRQAGLATGRLAQWGTAYFTDIGKTWSGDVPFGQTTVARASIGVGLLAAVPPKSRQTIRADFAVPVTGDAPKHWVLRVYAVDATRFFWRDPSDLAPVRAGAPASPIFGWP